MINIPDILEKASKVIAAAQEVVTRFASGADGQQKRDDAMKALEAALAHVHPDDVLAVLNKYGTDMMNLRDMEIIAIGYEPDTSSRKVAVSVHLKFGNSIIERSAMLSLVDAENIEAELHNAIGAVSPGKIIIPGAGGLA